MDVNGGGDEQRQASALRGYGILDSPNEPEFDRIVIEAAALAHTPIALISLLDEHRQWFKARVGLTASETPLAISFCTHAIRGEGEVFEVVDVAADARFRDNPLVTGRPNIRFYAGAPLKSPSGERIGTLCVIDDKPRAGLSPVQKHALSQLARRTVATMEARKRRRGG